MSKVDVINDVYDFLFSGMDISGMDFDMLDKGCFRVCYHVDDIAITSTKEIVKYENLE